jgi:hypothetical protein
MSTTTSNHIIKGDEAMKKINYRIEPFHAADAQEVTDLIKEVYGDGFPVETVYDPTKMIAAVDADKLIPFVARDAGNRLVGFTAVYPLAPYRGVREMGTTVTRLQDRNQGVSVLMYEYGLTVVAKQYGIELMYGEAVCNHTFTQRAVVKLKVPVVETALALDLMPAETYEKEQSASGRVSVVCIFGVIARKPHSVYIPAAYREPLRFIYEGIEDHRTLLPSKDSLTAAKKTIVSGQTVGSSGLGRLTITEAGEDFDRVFGQQEEELIKRGNTILQVWLKLASPAVGDVVDRLRKKGYCLGGVLLRWFNEDGLLMQKVIGKPNWEGIHLHSERMKKVMAFVREDWLEINC